MNVYNTVKRNLMLYPSIFKNKWDIYHHLFIVNGNGYEWKRGELIDFEDTRIPSTKYIVDKAFNLHFKHSCVLKIDVLLKNALESTKNDIITALDWEKNIDIFECDRDKIYPICQYSQLLNIPKNVREDWKLAAKDMLEWLTDNHKKTSKEDKKFIKSIKL